ncbi:hypothetical protein FB45DRAFT_1022435 [Roridomyces roridus]|uniref:Uncharacterized protein n=1 Tax=Roridomyces roridus TaxID=1738132 RepID=A0AAD7C8E9_9AGAR|nr:hypothetical protein FB45DRAFT_1022435 [Roridomyces roridus]
MLQKLFIAGPPDAPVYYWLPRDHLEYKTRNQDRFDLEAPASFDAPPLGVPYSAYVEGPGREVVRYNYDAHGRRYSTERLGQRPWFARCGSRRVHDEGPEAVVVHRRAPKSKRIKENEAQDDNDARIAKKRPAADLEAGGSTVSRRPGQRVKIANDESAPLHQTPLMHPKFYIAASSETPAKVYWRSMKNLGPEEWTSVPPQDASSVTFVDAPDGTTTATWYDGDGKMTAQTVLPGGPQEAPASEELDAPAPEASADANKENEPPTASRAPAHSGGKKHTRRAVPTGPTRQSGRLKDLKKQAEEAKSKSEAK